MKRGLSTTTPTKAEAEWIVSSKEGQCMACLVWARNGNMPMESIAEGCDFNHTKSGNIRRGHMFGFGLCAHHHRGVPGNGWDSSSMRKYFGPSLMDGSRLFHDTYGSDDYLINLQREHLGWSSDA